MRIVSLLPSLTELVCALGRGDELVGVTHECDFPPGVELLPHLTHSRIPDDASSGAIDALVAEQGGSLYDLDAAGMAELRPDLILTQEQCDVCAVNEATVRRTAATLTSRPHVESVNPTDLPGVFAMFERVGELLDARSEAGALVARFEVTAAAIGRRLPGSRRPRTVLLEWFDPPYSSGHWNPEIIALGGGQEIMAQPGARSRRLTWDALQKADPDLIILAPCGFTLERSAIELPALLGSTEWAGLRAAQSGNVVLADGSAYFSRPGPRLETSLRIAAAAVAPDACGELAPAGGWRRLPPVGEAKNPLH
ncbi:MAG: cobalamin-binding protein [Isosphaeraceae bacterium]|nr:cobalamin-binding protein [Isosphaeraceae bacterium]